MKHLKTFQEKVLSYIDKDVNIRFDIEASKHATDRFFRHGIGENKIEEGDILDVAERSIEELTIALMQDRLNVREPFVLKDKHSDLHIVAKILPGRNEFTLKIITVMVKEGFTTRRDQFFLEI